MVEIAEKKVKKNSILKAMLSVQPIVEDQEEKIEGKEQSANLAATGVVEPTKKRNERSYARKRGKDGSRAMSYYLIDDLIAALALKVSKSNDKSTKSSIVAKALTKELREEIKEVRRMSEEERQALINGVQ